MKIQLTVIIVCAFILMGATSPEGTLYTVRKGDTLSAIADTYLPYTAAYTKRELIAGIKEINKISDTLSPGQILSIPVVWDQPLKPETITKPKDFMAMGLYMNSSSAGTRFILDSAAKLRGSGGNTLVFDAKDDMGAITFPSPIPAKYSPAERYAPTIEALPKMIEFLHRMGIHVVARVVVFRDPIMSRAMPQWCINREKHWLNPANQEVQEYVLAVIEELSASGVDEIQLDYVRYHADGMTSTGIQGVPRTDVIAGFIQRVHEITQSKGVLLSVDMFGIVIWQRDVDVLVVGQDIAKIKPHVEIISPMLYPSHFSTGFAGVKNPADDPYGFVFKGIKKMKELVGEDVVIRPWLQSFPLGVTRGFGPGYIRAQMNATHDAGGSGWLLWSPGNHYDKAYAAMNSGPKQETGDQDPDLEPEVEKSGQPSPDEDALSVGQGEILDLGSG